MKEVADEMGVKAPTDSDILAILSELDEDQDDGVDKSEFKKLIKMVFDKMLENEEDLIKSINERN